VTYHIANIADDGNVQAFLTSDNSTIWINGGFFLLKPAIFDYMSDGEELVEAPFARLIAENKLMAYKHEGFWRSMDTLRDRQVLEDMIEKGDMPWRRNGNHLKKPG
jgi:glucose-1-phosphate cytidylyltransferase